MIGSAIVTRAHGEQRFEVRRDGAACREVAAGRRDVRAAGAREERSEQQNGPPEPADEGAIGGMRLDTRRPDTQGRGTDPLDLGADVEEQARHHLDVANPRHVGQHALLVREQTRGQQRQRRVLVPFDGNATFEPVTALDEQTRHQYSALMAAAVA